MDIDKKEHSNFESSVKDCVYKHILKIQKIVEDTDFLLEYNVKTVSSVITDTSMIRSKVHLNLPSIVVPVLSLSISSSDNGVVSSYSSYDKELTVKTMANDVVNTIDDVFDKFEHKVLEQVNTKYRHLLKDQTGMAVPVEEILDRIESENKS